MWLPFAVVLVLTEYAFAQGSDTIGSLNTVGAFNGLAQFNYVWDGETNHVLNNITVELMAGAAEDNGQDVQDIIAIGLSSDDEIKGFTCVFHTALPLGSYNVRMNGTIWNGSTDLGIKTTNRSNTFSYNGPNDDLLCQNIPYTPVRSVTDPGYTPLRLESPAGGSVITQTSDGIRANTLQIDVLFDTSNMIQTVDMINTQTGFGAGIQTISGLIFDSTPLYDTSHLTLDPGSWKFQYNFTSHSTHNPGSFSAESDEFFIVAVNNATSPCPASSPSSATTSPPSTSVPAGSSITQSGSRSSSAPASTGPGSEGAPASTGSGNAPAGSAPAGKGAGARLEIPLITVFLLAAMVAMI